MAKEITATAVPQTGPIVDPLPKLYEQFDPHWGRVFVRPPLKKDGTPITNAEDLETAEDNKDFMQPPSMHCWSGAACHATSLAMLLDWLVNKYPGTAGKVKIPNRTDETAPVDPLHVAYWLWQDGDVNQTKLVSEIDHPPYLPYHKDTDWKIDHDEIPKGAQTITLEIEGKAPEHLSYKRTSLKHPSVAQAERLIKRRDELSEQRKGAETDLEKVNKEIEEADRRKKAELTREQAKLKKKLESLDKQIEGVDAGEETEANAVVERQRRSNKAKLQRALLRGPVLMTMTVPSDHYILLVGYRDTTMYILDPGASIPNYWFGSQPDLANAPGGRMIDFRDKLAIDAEVEFEGVPIRKPKNGEKMAKVPRTTLRFIDNIKYYESYWFETVAKVQVADRTFDKTEPPEILPFDPRDCKLPGGG
jgi:hypothetical protein